MHETGRRANFWVGLGVGAVLGVVLLFSIFYVPRKGLDLFGETMTVHVLFRQAHGLQAGDPVLLNGLEVGEVSQLEVRQVPDVGVRCVATLSLFDRERHGALLRFDSIFTVGGEGLLGRRAVAIVAGGAGEPLAPGAVVPGTEPTDPARILEDVEASVGALRRLLEGGQPGDPSLRRTLKNLEAATRNIRELTEKLR